MTKGIFLLAMAPEILFFAHAEENAELKQAVLQAEKGNLGALQSRAQHGDALGAAILGDFYSAGSVVKRDHGKAFYWYTKGAAHPAAQFGLGILYYDGLGVPKDLKKSAQWYTKAAEAGIPDAQFNLGHIYSETTQEMRDYKKAVYWFQKASEQGFARAQLKLGAIYIEGRDGVPKNEREAFHWFTIGAIRGEPDAQYNLALMHASGNGIPQNIETAVRWLRVASKKGHAASQWNLGLMYDAGQGVSKDEAEALKWIILSCTQKKEDHCANYPAVRKKFESQMTQSQIMKATEAARQFSIDKK